jgi:hypothetical protein
VRQPVTRRSRGKGHRSRHVACARVRALGLASVLAIAAALAMTPAGRGAPGCDLHASPSGSDAADGTEERPFASAQQLADALSPGETDCRRAGTLRPRHGVRRDVLPRGTGGLARHLRSYPGERAKLVGIIDVGTGRDHITMSQLTIEGDGTRTRSRPTPADTVIEDSDITNLHRGRSCLVLGGAAGQAERTVVRRNVLHDCGAAGMATRITRSTRRSGRCTDRRQPAHRSDDLRHPVLSGRATHDVRAQCHRPRRLSPRRGHLRWQPGLRLERQFRREQHHHLCSD